MPKRIANRQFWNPPAPSPVKYGPEYPRNQPALDLKPISHDRAAHGETPRDDPFWFWDIEYWSGGRWKFKMHFDGLFDEAHRIACDLTVVEPSIQWRVVQRGKSPQ